MSGIRVNSGVKRVEVNDDGEYIVLNFGDQNFPTRFFAMLDKIKEIAKDAPEQEKRIRAEHLDEESETRELVMCNEKLHRSIMTEVDNLFGPDTCRKVFGDIVPGIDLFEEFFDQLLPFFEDYAKQRKAKMSKYNAGRTGNV